MAIIYNSSPKGRFFWFKSNGVPFKIWIHGYRSYNTCKLVADDSTKVPLVGFGSMNIKEKGTRMLPISDEGDDFFQMNASMATLYDRAQRGLNSTNWTVGKAFKPEAAASSSELTMVFDDLSAYVTNKGITNTVSGWNTFFDTSTNATTPFSDMLINGETLTLYGATDLTLKIELFYTAPRGGVTGLLSFSDTSGEVIAIRKNAFDNHSTFTNMYFPVIEALSDNSSFSTTSITGITENQFPLLKSLGGSNVFAGNTSLTTVDLPLLTGASVSMFLGDIALVSVNLPLLEAAGHSLFDTCSSLVNISLPSVTTGSNSLFQNCSKLEVVNLPLATSVESNMLRNCTSLTTITSSNFPLATSYEASAFQGCSNLVTFESSGATTFANYVFRQCTSIETLMLSAATSFGTDCFDGIAGQTITLTIPAALNVDPSVTALTDSNTVTVINP